MGRAAATDLPRRATIDLSRGRRAKLSSCADMRAKGSSVVVRHGSGAWAVLGGVNVRDRRVGRAGWLRRARGGAGRANSAPGVFFDHLVRLVEDQGRRCWRLCRPCCPACRTRTKVTSTLQVPGPSKSWSPAPAAFLLRRSQWPCAGSLAIRIDCSTRSASHH